MANKLEELGRFWWLKVKQHLWWERSKGRLWWTERFPVFRGGAAPDDTRKAWHGRALWANGSKVTNSSLARLKLLCSQVYLIKTFCWQGIQWSINSSSKIPLTFFLIFQKSVGWVQVEGKLQTEIKHTWRNINRCRILMTIYLNFKYKHYMNWLIYGIPFKSTKNLFKG